MSDDAAMKVFFELHQGNPREGPGSDECTRRAFELLEGLPDEPRILDLGCGPGAQTLELARLGAHVTAIDLHAPFVEDLRRRAQEAGLAERIDARAADMKELEFGKEFDAVWSEGAVYFLGFEAGLTHFRSFVRPGGYVAVSHLSWLTDSPSDETRAFWSEAYPEIRDVAANRAALERTGLEYVGGFALPPAAWHDEYYGPLKARIEELSELRRDDPGALEVLAAEQREIELFEAHSDEYGYTFFIGREPS